MQSKAKTVKQYLAELPEDRRDAIEAVRKTILQNLPSEYEEGMQYGMIGYFVPHRVYPPGYHCDPEQPLPFAALASQKNHMAVYLMCIYSDPKHEAWFRNAWAKTGKKLDMGKSCVRFKKIDDLPLKVIGQAVKRVPAKKYIAHYESATQGAGAKRTRNAATKKKSATKKTPKGKRATRQPSTRKKAPVRTAKARRAVARRVSSR